MSSDRGNGRFSVTHKECICIIAMMGNTDIDIKWRRCHNSFSTDSRTAHEWRTRRVLYILRRTDGAGSQILRGVWDRSSAALWKFTAFPVTHFHSKTCPFTEATVHSCCATSRCYRPVSGNHVSPCPIPNCAYCSTTPGSRHVRRFPGTRSEYCAPIAEIHEGMAASRSQVACAGAGHDGNNP